ncbi:MAG: lipopolysaccharide kinase InaA family protein, partial [Planctomycetota bacterium]
MVPPRPVLPHDPAPPPGEILKSGPSRAVLLAADPAAGEAGGRIVVKRFFARGLLGGWRARTRARREHALLAALSAAGLPVPRPLDLARGDGAWEVRMAWIPAARPLADWLRAGVPPGARERLLAALGRLLAAAHAAGLDDPDLHLGNVLVDAAGAPWLVDVHGARIRRRL